MPMSPNSMGFGKVTYPVKSTAKTDPGARPSTKDTAAAPLAGSIAQRDWQIADREYKENGIVPTFS